MSTIDDSNPEPSSGPAAATIHSSEANHSLLDGTKTVDGAKALGVQTQWPVSGVMVYSSDEGQQWLCCPIIDPSSKFQWTPVPRRLELTGPRECPFQDRRFSMVLSYPL